MTQNPAPELLTTIAKALYRGEWQKLLAADLGISPSSVRDWANGRNRHFTMDHPAWPQISALVDVKIEALAELKREIDQPPAESAAKFVNSGLNFVAARYGSE